MSKSNIVWKNFNGSVSFRNPCKGETLKAGKYLVIDPCYVIGEPESLWEMVCNALYPSPDENGKGRIVMEVGEHKIYIFNTAYGDGLYPVEVDGDIVGVCGVDAGLLSFIPKAFVDSIEGDESLGVWVNIPNEAAIYNNDEGDVEVGPIWVCTCGCSTEEDEEDGDDDWDEDDWEDEDEDWEEESDESDN